jgi:hypothetical protein
MSSKRRTKSPAHHLGLQIILPDDLPRVFPKNDRILLPQRLGVDELPLVEMLSSVYGSINPYSVHHAVIVASTEHTDREFLRRRFSDASIETFFSDIDSLGKDAYWVVSGLPQLIAMKTSRFTNPQNKHPVAIDPYILMLRNDKDIDRAHDMHRRGVLFPAPYFPLDLHTQGLVPAKVQSIVTLFESSVYERGEQPLTLDAYLREQN